MSTGFPLAPLRKPSDLDFQNLASCLWNWQLCGNCAGKDRCGESTCPWSRRNAVESALARYVRITSCYIPEDFATQQALSCHQDVRDIIQVIKSHPDEIKEDLLKRHFSRSTNSVHQLPAIADQERAFNLAASVLLVVNCGSPDDCADQYEDCDSALPWTSTISIRTFMAEVFAKAAPMSANGHTPLVESDVSKELTAKRLRIKAGLRFEATDDLHSHLRLDSRTRVVHVFGSTTMLEEMLLASLNEPEWCVLPRNLVLEVLHTIYKILFPPGRESRMALSFAKKSGFDNDFLRYTIERFRRDDDPAVDYAYFGDQLLELYQELKDPSPRNWFERLFEGGSKSAERKMLMATTIGVFIAVMIGLFGLVVAGFQAWVGYQQWKHPVKDS